MKRAHFFLTMTAAALSLIASQSILASRATAPLHAAPAASSQSNDTVNNSLLKSVTDLSKTAVNLSEAVLKLLDSQSTATPVNQKATAAPDARKDSLSNAVEEARSNTVFISEEIESTDISIPQAPATNRPGGSYIWIPDENLSAVNALLNGQPAPAQPLTPPATQINLNELTYWHGDSIPLAIPTKRLGRFDRKLYNWLIYPKGLWHFGLTANYGELNTEDSEFLSLIDDVDLNGKIYSIKPSVSYFIRNNVCVGLRLAFTKGEMGINSFNVDIDEDMSFNLHDIKYSSDSYAAAVFIQQYFGLSRRGRFAVFNEAEISYGMGSTHFIRPFDGELRDTRTKTQSFNINYSPGVSIMMMKNAAFNLSFGIFGFHLKNEKQWDNGEEAGSRFTSGINFRFNIFNINFGVAIII